MAFLIAFAIAIVMTPLAGWAGRAIGLVDEGGDPLKIHGRTIPATGGLAVAAAILLAVWPGPAAAGGVLLALAVGLADDLRPQRPALRLVLLAISGGLIGLAAGPEPATIGLGVGLVLLCSTSVNMVDGQDGLASGLAGISSLALALVATQLEIGTVAVFALALAGGLLGFLPWNFPRAQVFLGNSGAYAVGAAVAYLATQVIVRDGYRGLIVAGACLAVFALEFGVTLFRRLARRSPLTGGDRFHSYDLLAARIDRRAVTVTYWGFGALVAGGAVLLSDLSLGTALLVAAAGWAAGVLAAVLAVRATRGAMISDG